MCLYVTGSVQRAGHSAMPSLQNVDKYCIFIHCLFIGHQPHIYARIVEEIEVCAHNVVSHSKMYRFPGRLCKLCRVCLMQQTNKRCSVMCQRFCCILQNNRFCGIVEHRAVKLDKTKFVGYSSKTTKLCLE